MRIFSYIFLVLLTGCAAPLPGPSTYERGLLNLQQGNFEAAYRFFEDPPKDKIGEVAQIFKANPHLLNFGFSTLTPEALKRSIDRYGREESFKIEKKRLELFRGLGTSEMVEKVELYFADEFAKELYEYHKEIAEKDRVAKLPEAEQAKYWADRYKKWQESVTVYGRVLGAQLINESQPGNNFGSQFGSIVGQAAYIDSRNIFNYSALGQLQAGLLGGVFGAMADSKPVTLFRKVYFLKNKDGVKRIDVVDAGQVLLPVGACIAYREPFQINLAPEDKCENG